MVRAPLVRPLPPFVLSLVLLSWRPAGSDGFCALLRLLHHPSPSGPCSKKSSELNGDYRGQLQTKKTLLAKVQTDMRHIMLTLDGARAAIDNLKWNRSQLAAQVPDGGSSDVGEAERLQLAGSLRELGELIMAREALVDELMKLVDAVRDVGYCVSCVLVVGMWV